MAAGTVTELSAGAALSCALPKPHSASTAHAATQNLIFQIVAPASRPRRGPRQRILLLYNREFDLRTRERSGGRLPQAEIGIIGGSGLYSMPGLTKANEV